MLIATASYVSLDTWLTTLPMRGRRIPKGDRKALRRGLGQRPKYADIMLQGNALRCGQRDEGGFRFPPYIPLDSHTPLKRPGLWSWTWGCMISFANPHGSRVATLVVCRGEREAREAWGRIETPQSLWPQWSASPLSCESWFTYFNASSTFAPFCCASASGPFCQNNE